MNRKRIVIIGGGLAGLAAAESLLRHHRDRFDVCVIESKRSTGGRTGSFDDPETGHSVDYCQHVTMGCCTNLISLMQRCELSDAWQRYDQLDFLHPQFPASRFAPAKWLPAPFHLATSIGALKYLTWKQQRVVRRGLLKLMRTRPSQLGGWTADQWLRSVGQDRETIRDFWDVILVSALGEQTDKVAMTAARKVIIDGFAAAKGASDVLVPKMPLRQLIGERLSRSIEELGAVVDTACKVDEVSAAPRSIHSATRCWLADHVVCAVPWHQLKRVLKSNALQSSIEHFDAACNLPASPITGVHLWFDREITPLPHAALVGTLAQWLFRDPIAKSNADDAADDNGEHYYQVVISASADARQLSKDELVQRVVCELQQLFPATSHARLRRSVAVTNPQSVFSVSPEVEEIRPSARTALPWLHLAGDWIATGWPATMEGAVISGRMAVNSILESEQLQPLPIESGLPRGWFAKRLIAD
ncbi:hydroxysqualene dehydroxylase HpnE [Planctomycetes bacterium K23_9]|uniref:15-cis-phytoene desaturase n=1 Tax=Stieleria marina TaxID=1930275 RepID=A0A517NNS0_9BACT|nr:15-cis-phytoene desaturase [Planctomycetes bacterium K23_9]